ncbi:MAG TPA: hypothetical protein VND88_11760 [Candidatus Acidoferrales bacterium]|nr:hypothetical protein [Candidatus Acidoferrales bacterium]
MPNSMTARDEERRQEHRPGAVLYVYTWDLILVILALLVTLAPFAGAVQSSSGAQPLPFYAQVIEAVSSAAFAATLIILAALLTRRYAWVRIVQIGTLVTHITLAIISEIVLAISGNSAGVPGLLGTLLFVLLDGLAILIMTDRRVVTWYDQRAAIPVYAWAVLVLWVGGSALNIVLDAVYH